MWDTCRDIGVGEVVIVGDELFVNWFMDTFQCWNRYMFYD